MKENRKLLKEVLRDIRHDMTDEEVFPVSEKHFNMVSFTLSGVASATIPAT